MLAIIRHIIFTVACNEGVKTGKIQISTRKIFNHYLKKSNKKIELLQFPC